MSRASKEDEPMKEYNAYAPNRVVAAAMANASRARAQAAAAERARVAAAAPAWDPEENIWELEPEEFKVRLMANPEMVVAWLKGYRYTAKGMSFLPAEHTAWDACEILLRETHGRAASDCKVANIVHWMTTLPPWPDKGVYVGHLVPTLPRDISIEIATHAMSDGLRQSLVRDIVRTVCSAPRSRSDIRTTVDVLERMVAAAGATLLIGSFEYQYFSGALMQFDDADKWIMPLMVFMARELCRNREPRSAWRRSNYLWQVAPSRAWKLFQAMISSRDAYLKYLGHTWKPEGSGRFMPEDFDSRIRPFEPTREYDSDIEDAEEAPMQEEKDVDEDAAYDANQTGPMQLLSETLHENTTFPSDVSAMIMNMYLGQDREPDPRLTAILKARHFALNAPIRKAEGEPEEEEEKENGNKRSKP